MNISNPISAARAATVSVAPQDTGRVAETSAKDARPILNVTHSAMNDIDAVSGEIDLSDASFGELGALFDKAFALPPPPMPAELQEA